MAASAFGSDRDGDLQRLRAHFEHAPLTDHGKRWDELWEHRKLLLWDRGEPHPALVDALKDRKDLLGSPVRGNGERKRALVPGCGKGYDVLLLAAHGYDAVGLDISENAYKAFEEYAKEKGSDYKQFESSDGPGHSNVVTGDFFKDDFLADTSARGVGFDLIYDYTFFCALPPDARPAWARRMSQLLRKDPDSRLICLEFPTFKPPSTGGPPHGMNSETYIAHLNKPGDKIPYTAEGYAEPATYSEAALAEGSRESAMERIAHWKPERTHPAGAGKDWVSVWRHRS